MKKWIAAVLLMVITLTSTGSIYAQTYYSAGSGKIATGLLKDVKYAVSGSSETVAMVLEDYTDYSVMNLTNPDRVVIDIFNAAAPLKQQTMEINSNVIKKIRYAQFDPNTARVVLEVNGQPEYGINKTEDGLLLYIGGLPENPEDKVSTNPPAATTHAVKQKLSVHKYFNIEYAPKGSEDEVAILLGSYSKYKVQRLTGPDRLVIDIPNAKYSGTAKQLNVNGTQIKTVRYSKYGKSTARIVLDLYSQSQYTVKESKGRLALTLSNPTYKNIIYHNNGDRVYFTLPGAKLTDGGEYLQKMYTGRYDVSGKKYTITFPSAQADLGEGVFKINDDYVSSLEIATDEAAQTTSLTFNAANRFSYLIYTRYNVNDTAITILKPAAVSEKLVVIDAGHGGAEPGAIYKDLKEKNLNLDIAQKLNTLLQKKKIKTFMIRDDDTYVALYERAYIANNLKAAIFLSVHNNAMDDPDYRGTMTLNYPERSNASGLTGKDFAGIVQQQLLNRLGTINRKTVDRPNLVVLKATMMPSAIAEVAFLTNSIDRSNLQKESFRQKAAQALCDAVVKALPKAR